MLDNYGAPQDPDTPRRRMFVARNLKETFSLWEDRLGYHIRHGDQPWQNRTGQVYAFRADALKDAVSDARARMGPGMRLTWDHGFGLADQQVKFPDVNFEKEDAS